MLTNRRQIYEHGSYTERKNTTDLKELAQGTAKLVTCMMHAYRFTLFVKMITPLTKMNTK